MHSVSELHSFRRAAAEAGMSDDEVDDLITYLADNPMAGEEIVGTGGCRKLRWPGRGKGKRGRIENNNVLLRERSASLPHYRVRKG